MKKGCFIRLIIIITIVTAAAVYIIKNYYKEVILEPGKKVITGLFVDDFNEKFAYVAESPEKDSLRSIISSVIVVRMEKDKEISDESLEDFFRSIKYVFRDSIITAGEVEEIKKLAGSIK